MVGESLVTSSGYPLTVVKACIHLCTCRTEVERETLKNMAHNSMYERLRVEQR